MIKIEKDRNYYAVRFYDENGVSNLSKVEDYKLALKKAKKFRNDLKTGKLLKAEKSAWK
jgi:hypothetical protein